MPEQRHNPVYAADSPDWEAWFTWEHEEQRRCGIRDVVVGQPSPLIVSEEEQEAKAAHQNALAAVLRASEEEARLKEEEEEAYQKQLAEAIALSAVCDCVVPSLAPPPLPSQDHWSSRPSYTPRTGWCASGSARHPSGWVQHRSRRHPTWRTRDSSG
ncbi:hypothetical protein D1007_22520 [Hordeum vulgare]|nr:hypothetical protein D1007_22520 [Hordeum vulgare]